MFTDEYGVFTPPLIHTTVVYRTATFSLPCLLLLSAAPHTRQRNAYYAGQPVIRLQTPFRALNLEL